MDDLGFTEEEKARNRRLVAQAEAAQARWRSMPRQRTHDLESMLRDYAYMHSEDRIVDLNRPDLTYSRQGFKNATAASVRIIIGARGSERAVPIADDWMQHEARVDVYGRTFHPNAKRITPNLAGSPCVNLWTPLAIEAVALPQGWRALASVFVDHMAQLLPDPVERANVVRWLAHRVQRPQELPGWHPLLIAENAQGTGRNWVARLMKLLLGAYCIEALPLLRILEGNFNGEIDRGIVGVVDEIREGGGDYWKHAEALKSFLTEKTRVINQKYERPYEVQNFLGVMMFSNHLAALPLDRTDRRIYVARCTEVIPSAAYFDDVYAALQDTSVLRSIYEQLRTVDLRGFQILGRAPETEMKRELVQHNTMPYEALLQEFVEEWPTDVIPLRRLTIEMNRKVEHDYPIDRDRPRGLVPTGAALNNIYARLGMKGDIRPKMNVRGPDGSVTREKVSVIVLRNWRSKWQGIKATGNLAAFAEEAELGEEEADRRRKDDSYA
jgi:hypothetical protein